MPLKTVSQELERLKRNKNTYAKSLTIVHDNVKAEVKAALTKCDKDSPEAICLGKNCYFTFNTGSKCNFYIVANPIPQSRFYFVKSLKGICDNIILDINTHQALITSIKDAESVLMYEVRLGVTSYQRSMLCIYEELHADSLTNILRSAEHLKNKDFKDIRIDELKKSFAIIQSVFSHYTSLEKIF